MNIILENMVNKFSLVSYNWKYFPKIHESRALEFRKKIFIHVSNARYTDRRPLVVWKVRFIRVKKTHQENSELPKCFFFLFQASHR